MFDERTERNIATLHPRVQNAARMFMRRALELMAPHGVEVKIISGTRTYEEQDELYAKGRTKPGPRVTNARGGYSNHNFGIAFDIGLFKDHKYLESSPLYREVSEAGKSIGLEWGGDWKSFQDEPHYQYPAPDLKTLRERKEKNLPIL